MFNMDFLIKILSFSETHTHASLNEHYTDDATENAEKYFVLINSVIVLTARRRKAIEDDVILFSVVPDLVSPTLTRFCLCQILKNSTEHIPLAHREFVFWIQCPVDVYFCKTNKLMWDIFPGTF